MEMADHQYGLPDLRHLLTGGRPQHFSASFSQDQFSNSPHYDLLMLGSSSQVVAAAENVANFSDSNTTTTSTDIATVTATTSLCGFENNHGGNNNNNNARWPRQETLTLLEIRSHLDSKFKEANQKGPLWDEVSRIMAEEHGHQRSGKKCREKFENLYKYYKKTKEGKAGRQDGKNYRFFRQLEALYGDSSNNSVSDPHYLAQNHTMEAFKGQQQQFSESNSSGFESSSEDGDHHNDNESMVMKKRGRRSWKSKIKEFVDSQMRRLMETQEAWLEKMLKTIEDKEHERMCREEEWRKREAARIDQEHKFWANERAWFEARDAALMVTLKKITGKELMENNGSVESTLTSTTDKWPESEISSLIHLRTSLESRFQQNEYSKETLWIEISGKMACLGYDKSAKCCEEKWDDINNYIRRSNECSKKRRENSRSSNQYQHDHSAYNNQGGGGYYGHGINQHDDAGGAAAAVVAADGFFPRFLLADQGENLWENYDAKINRGENQ
ncbi:hypothetical protein ACHQM5_021295 [Ranunculus cassubicifolius]